MLIINEKYRVQLWPQYCIRKRGKEVIMKNVIMKGLVFSVLLGLFLSFLPLIQADTSTINGKININTASLTELQKLPRIGEKVAQRIIDYRKTHGKFKKVEEIMKVRGIGEKVFKRIKDLITVGKPAKTK